MEDLLLEATFDDSAKAPHFSAGMSAASPKAKLSKRQKEEAADFSRRSLTKDSLIVTIPWSALFEMRDGDRRRLRARIIGEGDDTFVEDE